MKKIGLGLLFSVLFISSVYANKRISVNGVLVPPVPGVYNTDSVYLSSCVCVSSSDFKLVIATRPAAISHITVSSVSANHTTGVFNVWDAMESSNTARGARLLAGPFPTNVRDTYWFKTTTSSGVIINIDRHAETTEAKPCFQIWHFEK